MNENNQVFHDRPVCCISVRLSDKSEVTQHKINFFKNCPQCCLNPQPPEHYSNPLPTELRRNGVEISEVNFVCFKHHFTY